MQKYKGPLAIIISVAIAVVVFAVNPFKVDGQANKVLAVGIMMILLWVTEALPMPVVALLPMVFFPLLDISTLKVVASSYADPIIFLFMGGFMLGLAIEKWNLHRRIALNIVQLTGTSGNRIILGFILATGLISMWLSNTATTMMMFPIALSVIHVLKESENNNGSVANFSLVLMLVIAYASNFGGIATIIGTPPNVAFVGYIKEKYNRTIEFSQWLLLCTPLAILLLITLYLVMVKWLFPNRIKSDAGTKGLIKNEINKLGGISSNEKRVLVIFSATALLWITKDIINRIIVFKLDDTIIALMGAVALFVCPANQRRTQDIKSNAILEWRDTKNMAWGILLLFGGGIALASALEKAGLIQQLGHWLAQFAGNRFVLILVITCVSLFISEVMSNVAQVIVFAPVVCSLADALQMNPLLLGIPMTLAASCACMLPMGTPPNAIVFSSGHIKLNQMTRAGFVMNIIAVVLITLFSWFILPAVLTF